MAKKNSGTKSVVNFESAVRISAYAGNPAIEKLREMLRGYGVHVTYNHDETLAHVERYATAEVSPKQVLMGLQNAGRIVYIHPKSAKGNGASLDIMARVAAETQLHKRVLTGVWREKVLFEGGEIASAHQWGFGEDRSYELVNFGEAFPVSAGYAWPEPLPGHQQFALYTAEGPLGESVIVLSAFTDDKQIGRLGINQYFVKEVAFGGFEGKTVKTKRMEAHPYNGVETMVAKRNFANALGGNTQYLIAIPDGTSEFLRDDAEYNRLVEIVRAAKPGDKSKAKDAVALYLRAKPGILWFDAGKEHRVVSYAQALVALYHDQIVLEDPEFWRVARLLNQIRLHCKLVEKAGDWTAAIEETLTEANAFDPQAFLTA